MELFYHLACIDMDDFTFFLLQLIDRSRGESCDMK